MNENKSLMLSFLVVVVSREYSFIQHFNNYFNNLPHPHAVIPTPKLGCSTNTVHLNVRATFESFSFAFSRVPFVVVLDWSPLFLFPSLEIQRHVVLCGTVLGKLFLGLLETWISSLSNGCPTRLLWSSMLLSLDWCTLQQLDFFLW